nr:MAG TPA: holin [Caudoviricetes sp.]
MYLIIVLGFIMFDVVTGLIKAGYNGNYNSAIMRQGGFHKSMEVMAMAVAYFIEYAIVYINIGVDVPAVPAVTVYICIMELISILENICAVNPQMCALFKPYLDKLKGGNDASK